MTPPNTSTPAEDPIGRGQSYRIKEALDNRGIPVQIEEAADGTLLFMCHSIQILVREDRLAAVQRLLGQPLNRSAVRQVTDGVVTLRIDLSLLPAVIPQDVVGVVQAVDRAFGVEGIATPDHVLTVCDGVLSPCPANEPVPPESPTPFPALCRDNGGDGAVVYIADTGLVEDALKAHPWLDGVERATNPDGTAQDWDPAVRDGTIGLYGGHGTYVAGMVRGGAPRARVIVSNVFKNGGSALESEFVADLTAALEGGVNIFNVTVSAPTRHDLPLMAFRNWLRKLNATDAVCVCPAGNSGGTTKSWPAAFPQVIAVGALDSAWKGIANFSNSGPWVNVYAPGTDMVNAFPTGTYTYHDAPKTGNVVKFNDGMALWSGTSFSTPIVTGLIARQMGIGNMTGKQAAAEVLRNAKQEAIGAVLYPPCR